MISQPMNGKTSAQIKEERKEIVEKLQKEGHEVIDTVFTEVPAEAQYNPLSYLAKSIEAMSEADGIVFMRGWQNARGCVTEHEIALRYNKYIKEL
jgi:hypothetical protein